MILVGDVREKLRELPENHFHCVVTSPPYWGMRDYGVAGQIGLEKSFEEFLATMVEVFREVRRVLRPDGVLWLNMGDCYAASGGAGTHKPKDLLGQPWRLAFALQADGMRNSPKKESGRLLDGREWNEIPEAKSREGRAA